MEANERQDDIRYFMSLGFTEEQATMRADAIATRRKEKEKARDMAREMGLLDKPTVTFYFK